MNADGSEQRKPDAQRRAFDNNPAWSPDGQKISLRTPAAQEDGVLARVAGAPERRSSRSTS